MDYYSNSYQCHKIITFIVNQFTRDSLSVRTDNEAAPFSLQEGGLVIHTVYCIIRTSRPRYPYNGGVLYVFLKRPRYPYKLRCTDKF